MEGDFSFELEEGTDIDGLLELKGITVHCSYRHRDCKGQTGLCMQLTQHWGSCQRWRLCVQSGTGIRSCWAAVLEG